MQISILSGTRLSRCGHRPSFIPVFKTSNSFSMRSFGFVFLSTFLCLASSAAFAADDSQPIVLSTAGDSWSDLGELQKAAAAGKPPALAALGEMLLTGDGITKDVPHGIEMLDKASAAGQGNATFRLGKVYEEGTLVPADPHKAMDYYHRAALAGVAEAQYNLGAMYVSARGVPRDYKEGLAWIIVATKHGADADGEKRVRDRLASTRRADIIPAAELRANELDVEVTQAMHSSVTGQPVATTAKKNADLPAAISNK